MLHLFYSSLSADVVPSCELVCIAGQVFFAEVVIGSVDTAFEHRPKRLHSVGMGSPDRVLSPRMHDRCVVVKPCC